MRVALCKKTGLTQAEYAKKIGKNQPHVLGYLSALGFEININFERVKADDIGGD
ncbi:MAG: hypothetical protein V6Z82_00190 [Flavobacteriales bacterium]